MTDFGSGRTSEKRQDGYKESRSVSITLLKN